MNKKLELISIVVPIYNVDKYISECIESLLAQTYDNIEILMINDGSSDASFAIASDYAIKDKRITLVDKVNSGVSATRNLGIDMAKGEYLMFVDSDDLVENDYVEKMYESIQYDPKIDIVICNMLSLSEDGEIQTDIPKSCTRTQIIDIDTSYKFQRGLQHLSACAVLYKRKVIGDIRFNTDIQIGEDALFHNEVFVKCKKAVFLNQTLYHYIFHQNSAFKAKFNEKRLSEINAWNGIVNVYCPFKKAYRSAKAELCIRCMTIYKMVCLDEKNRKLYGEKIIAQLRENLKYILCCKANIRVVSLCLWLAVFPNSFRYVYKVKTIL